MTQELADLAHRAAAAVGASLAGVDVLPGKDGRLYVLRRQSVRGHAQRIEPDAHRAPATA